MRNAYDVRDSSTNTNLAWSVAADMGLQERDYYPDMSDDESWRGPKPKKQLAITTILIFICVAVSIAELVTSSPLNDKSGAITQQMYQAAHPLNTYLSLSTDPRDLLWKPWSILTYGFAHSPFTGPNGGITHLLFNMIGLYFFGNFCEQFLGRKEFLRFYLAAVIFAGLAYFAVGVALSQSTAVVGASGALLACLVLAAWKFPMQKVYLYGVVELPLWGVAAGYVAMDLYGVLSRSESNTAFTCHLGGALFATLYTQLKWNFGFLDVTRWGTWRRQATTRRNLKVHSETEEVVNLADQADQLLQKVQDKGIDSLSKRERELLERYSREVSGKRRNRD